MSLLNSWDTFFIIIAAAAGALIGLQFVVVTLVAEHPPVGPEQAGAAFATPTIVHFSSTLLISALINIPWQTVIIISALCGIIGLSGMIYSLIVARRMRIQIAYMPVFEDWLFHVLMPLLAYAMLFTSAFMLPNHTRDAMFFVGSSALLLLFIGIHNAWDSIAYHVFVHIPAQKGKK